MTIQEILNYGKNTNTPIELNGACSYLGRTAFCISGDLKKRPASICKNHLRFPNQDIKTQRHSYVGIEVKTKYSEQYYWFKTYSDINDENAYWFFDHAYNRNNGISTYRKGKRVWNLIMKIEQH